MFRSPVRLNVHDADEAVGRLQAVGMGNAGALIEEEAAGPGAAVIGGNEGGEMRATGAGVDGTVLDEEQIAGAQARMKNREEVWRRADGFSSGHVLPRSVEMLSPMPYFVRARSQGKMTDQVRRFCYRLDSIRKWERVRWNDFQDDAEPLAKLRRRTTDLFVVLVCSTGLGRFSAEVLRAPDVRAAVKRYQEKLPAAKTQQERTAAELLVKDLRLAATIDVEDAQRRITCDHFAKMLGPETQMREPVPAW